MTLFFTATESFQRGCQHAAKVEGKSLSAFIRSAVLAYCKNQYEDAQDIARSNKEIVELRQRLRELKPDDPTLTGTEPDSKIMARATFGDALAKVWGDVLIELLGDGKAEEVKDE